jgi:hypothetical protein
MRVVKMPTEAVETIEDIKGDRVEENEHEFGARAGAGERFQFGSFLRKQKKEKRRKDSAEMKDTTKIIRNKDGSELFESRDPFESEKRGVAAEETRETSRVASLIHSEQNQEEEEVPSHSNITHKKKWIPAIFSSQPKEDIKGAVKTSTSGRAQGISQQVGAAEPQKHNEMAGKIACDGKAPPPIRHSDSDKDTELLGGQRTIPGMVPSSLKNLVSWIRPEPKRLQDPNASDPVLSQDTSARGQDESEELEKNQKMNAVEKDTLKLSESPELTDTSTKDTEVIISEEELIDSQDPSFLERAGTIGTKPRKSSKKADAIDSGTAPDHQDPGKAVDKELSKELFAQSSVLAVLDDEGNMEKHEDKAAPVALLVKQRKTSSDLNGLVPPVYRSRWRSSEAKRESFPSSKGRKIAYLENMLPCHREITVVSKSEGDISQPTDDSLAKTEAVNAESVRLPERNYSCPLRLDSKSQTSSSLLSAENESPKSDGKAALTCKGENLDDTPSIPISLKSIAPSLKVPSKSMPVDNRVPTLSERKTLFEAQLGCSMCSVLNIDPAPELTSLPSFAMLCHTPKEVYPINRSNPPGEETVVYQGEEGLDSGQPAASLETNDHDGESQFLSLSERKSMFQTQLRASSSIFSRKEFAAGAASSTSKNDEPVSGSNIPPSIPLQADIKEMSRHSDLLEEGAEVQAPSLLERKRVFQAKLQSSSWRSTFGDKEEPMSCPELPSPAVRDESKGVPDERSCNDLNSVIDEKMDAVPIEYAQGEQAEIRFLPLTERKKIFQKNISSADISRREYTSVTPSAEHMDDTAKGVPSANYAQERLPKQQEDNPSAPSEAVPGSEQAETRAYGKIVRKTKINGSPVHTSSRASQAKSKVSARREHFNDGTSASAIFQGDSEVDVAKVPSPTPAPAFTEGGSEMYSSKAPAPVPLGSVKSISNAAPAPVPSGSVQAISKVGQPGIYFLSLSQRRSFFQSGSEDMTSNLMPPNGCDYKGAWGGAKALTIPRTMGPEEDLKNEGSKKFSECLSNEGRVKGGFTSLSHRMDMFQSRCNKSSCSVFKADSSKPTRSAKAAVRGSENSLSERNHQMTIKVGDALSNHVEVKEHPSTPTPEAVNNRESQSRNFESPQIWRRSVYQTIGYHDQFSSDEDPSAPISESDAAHISSNEEDVPPVSTIYIDNEQIFNMESPDRPRVSEFHSLIPHGKKMRKRVSDIDSGLNDGQHVPMKEEDGALFCIGRHPSLYEKRRSFNSSPACTKGGKSQAKSLDPGRRNSLQRFNPKHSTLKAAVVTTRTKATDGTWKCAGSLTQMEEERKPWAPSYDSRRNFFEAGGTLSTLKKRVETPTKSLPQNVLETRPKVGEEAPKNLTELNAKPEAKMSEKWNDLFKSMPTKEQNAPKRQDCPRRPPSYYERRNFFESKSGSILLPNNYVSHPRLSVPKHHTDIEQCSKEGDENSLGLPVMADSPAKPHNSSEMEVASPSKNNGPIRSVEDPSSRLKPVYRAMSGPLKPLSERRSFFRSHPDRAGPMKMLSIIQNPVSSKKTDLTKPSSKESPLLQPKNSLTLDWNGDWDKLNSSKEMASTGKALTGRSYDDNRHTLLESSSSSSSGDEAHLGVPIPPHPVPSKSTDSSTHFPSSSFISEPPSPQSAKASPLNTRRGFVSLRQTPRGSHRDLRCF